MTCHVMPLSILSDFNVMFCHSMSGFAMMRLEFVNVWEPLD